MNIVANVLSCQKRFGHGYGKKLFHRKYNPSAMMKYNKGAGLNPEFNSEEADRNTGLIARHKHAERENNMPQYQVQQKGKGQTFRELVSPHSREMRHQRYKKMSEAERKMRKLEGYTERNERWTPGDVNWSKFGTRSSRKEAVYAPMKGDDEIVQMRYLPGQKVPNTIKQALLGTDELDASRWMEMLDADSSERRVSFPTQQVADNRSFIERPANIENTRVRVAEATIAKSESMRHNPNMPEEFRPAPHELSPMNISTNRANKLVKTKNKWNIRRAEMLDQKRTNKAAPLTSTRLGLY